MNNETENPTAKICPLLLTGVSASAGSFYPTRCIEHACAWWDGRQSRCVFATAALAMERLVQSNGTPSAMDEATPQIDEED